MLGQLWSHRTHFVVNFSPNDVQTYTNCVLKCPKWWECCPRAVSFVHLTSVGGVMETVCYGGITYAHLYNLVYNYIARDQNPYSWGLFGLYACLLTCHLLDVLWCAMPHERAHITYTSLGIVIHTHTLSTNCWKHVNAWFILNSTYAWHMDVSCSA